MKKILITSDILATIVAFFIAYYFRDKGPFLLFLDHVQPFYVYLLVLPFTALLLVLILFYFSLYSALTRLTAILEIYRLFQAVGLWLLLLMAGSYLVKYDYSRLILLLYSIFTFSLIMLGRLMLRHLLKKGWRKNKIIIIGRGPLAAHMVKKLKSMSDLGYQLVGQYSYSRGEKFNRISARHNIDELWFIDEQILPEEFLKFLALTKNSHVTIRIYSDMFGRVTGQVSLDNIDTLPVIRLARARFTPWQRHVKRIVDIILASLLLPVTFPLWLIIAIVIKFDSPGPILFRQKRIGYKGKPFFLFKFRTMKESVKTNALPPKKAGDHRITRVGRYLRRTSLDELPQLLNVLRGEMSLVGPRPEMPFIVDRYEPWQRRRLEIKPGLTGLWQVVGRKDLPLFKHLEYDFYYINNQSLLFDFAIILKTIIYVVLGKGAY